MTTDRLSSVPSTTRLAIRTVLALGVFLGLVLAAPAAPVQAGDPPKQNRDMDLPIAPVLAIGEDPHTEEVPEEEDGPTFYDEEIPTDSESVIYVIDRSSSMSLPVGPFTGIDGQTVTGGTRMDQAKTELKRSVASLPESFTFNMINYSHCVVLWRGSRMQATPENKAAAFAWIDSITPWGWTNTGGAVVRGLNDKENLAIVLLSDGVPNFLDCAQTYVGDYETHRRVIREANTQNATIDCFGIGLAGNPDARSFMQAVAQDNNGTYREIN